MTHAWEKLVTSLRAARQIDSKTQNNLLLKEKVFRTILGFPPDAAKVEGIARLFGKDYAPGTFAVGEISQNPDYLCGQTTIGYEPWVRQEIQRDIKAMIAIGRLDDATLVMSDIEDEILELLSLELGDGRRLRDMIALQEYTDIFRRLILSLILGTPECEVNTYEGLNKVGGVIALAAVSELDGTSLPDLLRISLAAGLVGLNLKTSAAATSEIHQPGIIPIDPSKDPGQQLQVVLRSLRKKAQEDMAIDYWEEYEEVILGTRRVNLVVFTDDYIETIFDLKFVERELEHNPKLNVWLIPRARCYGNDASYQDVIQLLEEPIFRKLKLQKESGRFEVSPDGPRLGTVNGLRISQDVANRLERCDAVFVKGARAYEMLRGVGKDAYFGFAVCRELSEVVTGIDAEMGRLVFIRQRPYQKTFAGFRHRRIRAHKFSSGRTSFLCPITAKDLHEEDLVPSFYQDLCEQGCCAIREQRVEVSPFLEDLSQDSRRGLTLIARPSSEIIRGLAAVNERLRAVAPAHFYYKAARFHFTIISLITAHEDFHVQEIPRDLYEHTIRETLKEFPPFEVYVAGVGPTRGSIIAMGFPQGGTLEAIRETLRDRLHAAGLGHSIDERYRSRGAHVTLARLRIAEDFGPLMRCLDTLRQASCGRMWTERVQLVVNDFYMSPAKVRLVAELELTGEETVVLD